jgi:hypothetical protein
LIFLYLIKTPSLADINNGKPIYIYVFFFISFRIGSNFRRVIWVSQFIYYYLKSIDTELTQYLWPVAVGPSLNKCPKWLPQLAQTISVRVIPCVLSKTYLTFPGIESRRPATVCIKL